MKNIVAALIVAAAVLTAAWYMRPIDKTEECRRVAAAWDATPGSSGFLDTKEVYLRCLANWGAGPGSR
jgi:hypothetical protein